MLQSHYLSKQHGTIWICSEMDANALWMLKCVLWLIRCLCIYLVIACIFYQIKMPKLHWICELLLESANGEMLFLG